MNNAPISGEMDAFPLGWLRMPGSVWEAVGSVTLPDRPTTLGEARGGLQMIANDAPAARWLSSWAAIPGEQERSVLLRLPGGWYELSDATIASIPGGGERYLVRFNRRRSVAAPE
jgi:hypothetical protein